MAEQRRENSLLISLRELRNIEDERVKEEEDAIQQAKEAEERARQDVIRRAREEEERKVREAEDKVRREREEKERQIREEQLRLEEAERRARIEAQAKLEEARIQAEARIRVAKAPPVRLIIGITLGVLLVAGSVLGYMVNEHNKEQTRLKLEADAALRAKQKQLEAEREAAEAAKRQLDQQLLDLNKKLSAATSEVEREKIKRQMEEARRESANRAKPKKQREDGKPVNTGSDDPLGNLPGLN